MTSPLTLDPADALPSLSDTEFEQLSEALVADWAPEFTLDLE